MTKAEARKLIRVVETLHERAYRRGFHHGVVREVESSSGLDGSAVAAWRHSGISTRTKPIFGVGVAMTIRDRILCETRTDAEDATIRALYRLADSAHKEN